MCFLADVEAKRSGNWTNPDGSVLANVVGGVGGEFGFVDHNNVFNLSRSFLCFTICCLPYMNFFVFTVAQYTVQFPVDKAYGYVTVQGTGLFGHGNELIV